MNDWYLLLTPLFVLAVMLLLGFAGCGIDAEGRGPAVEPMDPMDPMEETALAVELSFTEDWTLTSWSVRAVSIDGMRETDSFNETIYAPGPDVRRSSPLALPEPAVGTWDLRLRIKIEQNVNERTNDPEFLVAGTQLLPDLPLMVDESGRWLARVRGSGVRAAMTLSLESVERLST